MRVGRCGWITSLSAVLMLHIVACGADPPGEATPPSATGAAGAAGAIEGLPGLCPNDPASLQRPAHWTVESHCSGVEAGYDELFDPTIVRRLDIAVSADDYAAMLDFLRENFVEFTGDLDALPPPPWVPATVEYDGKQWTNVGLRHKGHASLKGGYINGLRKLSLKLRFDEFEDAHPELKDQRFYGFKTLNLANGYKDPSLTRDKIGAEIYRDAGVAAARSSYVAVYLDAGDDDDPRYMGLYTVIEDPADRMLEEQFGDGSGNLYKPWSDPARWLSPTALDQAKVETYFEKKTNELDSDWADVWAALTALHADRTDASTWRTGLEEVFNVSSFLRALAVGQVMFNWDSYGCKPHNYYVYANPLDGNRFTWIPWDLNEVMAESDAITCRPPGSVMLDEIVAPAADSTIDTEWPLIQFILSDEVYRATYVDLVREVLEGAFAAEPLIARIQADHDLVAPYVLTDELTAQYKISTSDAFIDSVNVLAEHVRSRHEAVESALADP